MVGGPPITRQDDAVRDALDASVLGRLPPAVLARLVADARRVHLPAGSALHSEGDSQRHFELVLSGLMRVVVSAPDGRTLTVRYCRPGQLIGTATLFAEPFSMPATVEAVVESEVLAMRPATVRRLVGIEAQMAQAMLVELGNRVMSFVPEIQGGAFATVGQRIARHLLDLATERQPTGELTAEISQQDLAEAVGSVREVVVRELRRLREAGIVQTGRREIVIRQPAKLVEWNAGS